MDPKDNTIHLIGNAHIDPVWLWRWTEGYQETRATFRSALDRLGEFPEFVFTASQAAVYQQKKATHTPASAGVRVASLLSLWEIDGATADRLAAVAVAQTPS